MFKSRKGAFVLAGTFALVFFDHLSPRQMWLLGVPIVVLLVYGLSGWFTKKEVFVYQKIGRFLIVLMGCSGAVFLYAWQFYALELSQRLESRKDVLEPDRLPTPPNVCGSFVGSSPANALLVLLGNEAAFAVDFPVELIRFDDQTILTMNRLSNGDVSISTEIYDDQENIVTEIKDNHFLVSNDAFDAPRPDLSTLTVILRHHKETVLDVHYLNPKSLSINGVFRYPGLGKPTLSIAGDVITINGRMQEHISECWTIHKGQAGFVFESH